MIRDLGIVRPGTTIYLPFHTFDSNDPSASVTLTGLATTDIEIYKDGSTIQRASDAGYALLDTDGTDFDGITGVHGISIDLADNTTVGFYEAGSQYWVVISSVTVDAATINFVLATFTIGYPDALLNTTIATLASQTSFTLEEGPADNDALNGCRVVIHDVASAVQIAQGVVSDYVGSTRTVTLAADPGIFTMATGDNISFFPSALVSTIPGRTLDVAATGEAGIDLANVNGTLDAADIGADAITAAKIAPGALAKGDQITGFNDLSTTQVNTEVDTALSDIHLDHLLATNYDPASKPGVATALLNELVENDVGVSRFTANALEQAPTGGSAPTVDQIADAVWDEDTTGHTGVGTFGEQLKTDVDAILADTNELQTDDVPGLIAALNNISVTDILTTQMTESYAANGAAPTLAQGIFAIHQMLMQFGISGTSYTVRQLDDSTTAFVVTLDDAANPTDAKRV